MKNPDDVMHGAVMGRRDFLYMTAGTAVVAALSGCATNPVTGKNQLMFVSEGEERRIDLENAPHQFSEDYGAAQDAALNEYLTQVGQGLAVKTHRPNMPYTFRVVNAVHVNAYTFPAGSMTVTRGMLAAMQSEAELAAVLGHELGHVNSRHTAQSMTKGIIAQALVAVAATALEATDHQDYAGLVAIGGMVGTGLYLARYSRKHEWQADGLGMKYMTDAGYPPRGMVGVMEILRKLSHDKPNVIELMFATHPMSEDRYQAALKSAETDYAGHAGNPDHRERYMDSTAGLRALKGALEQMQKAAGAMAKEKLPEALGYLDSALKQAPDDYAGLVMSAKCHLAQGKQAEAERFAESAKAVYPQEAQAYHISGMAKMKAKKFDAALAEFDRYEEILPGNPSTTFFKGYAYEGMNRKASAAEHYRQFLRSVQEGELAEHAYQRLVAWGYIQPAPAGK